jgi:hypothetical protein
MNAYYTMNMLTISYFIKNYGAGFSKSAGSPLKGDLNAGS